MILKYRDISLQFHEAVKFTTSLYFFSFYSVAAGLLISRFSLFLWAWLFY